MKSPNSGSHRAAPTVSNDKDARLRPNFFIVGAPKCGTTALYTYLAQHPDIYMPRRKEPRFFASDLDSGSPMDARRFVRSWPQYVQLFAQGVNRSRRGEATALYLFSTVAAQRIRLYCPESKIIIMVRNPVDLMYSFHSERFHNGNEDIRSFREAVVAEADRRHGRRIPRDALAPAALQYRQVATLSPQIERYLQNFVRSSIHFIVFEDLVRDGARVFRELMQFLEIDSAFTPLLGIHNANKHVRLSSIRTLLRRPPNSVRQLARTIAPVKVRQALKARVHRINTLVAPRMPMDSLLRRQLVSEFVTEVTRLSEIIGRDLSAWSTAD